ncbi:Cell death protease [Borealophlyctis nickersoniae]|nr:Cell death protease [Borealophlyctis nickersoniae]
MRAIYLPTVEQPVGVGYSFAPTSDFVKNETEVADDFYDFLTGFYSIFPETKSYNFYVTGESYAGMYIPYITQGLAQKAKLPDGTPINLNGILVIDGLFNAAIQETSDLFAKFLDESGFFGNDANAKKSAYALSQTPEARKDAFNRMYDFANAWYKGRNAGRSFSYYNIEKEVTYTDGRESAMGRYLSDARTREDFHVSSNPSAPTVWQECSDQVGSILDANESPPSDKVLPVIIDAGIPVTLAV